MDPRARRQDGCESRTGRPRRRPGTGAAGPRSGRSRLRLIVIDGKAPPDCRRLVVGSAARGQNNRRRRYRHGRPGDMRGDTRVAAARRWSARETPDQDVVGDVDEDRPGARLFEPLELGVERMRLRRRAGKPSRMNPPGGAWRAMVSTGRPMMSWSGTSSPAFMSLAMRPASEPVVIAVRSRWSRCSRAGARRPAAWLARPCPRRAARAAPG
jgi:hypothetical protein